MKQLLLILFIFLFSTLNSLGSRPDSLTLSVFEDVIYFDGYAAFVPLKVGKGLYRSNTSYTRRLSGEELYVLTRGQVKMHVDLKAACDNYDRLAHVSILFVAKGKPYTEVVKQIEIGRFITPFMDMNKQPNVRPYLWDVSAIADVLRNGNALKKYDIYVEMNVFGVPYAAQKQIKGCDGRNNVFVGNLHFTVFPQKNRLKTNFKLTPIAYIDTINNYKSTDTLGKTTKMYNFSTVQNLKELNLFIITSNHGANRNGEEYNRRLHYVYLDNNLIFKYVPGESTCEPYRLYNTQSNGIYGKTVKTDGQWQKFSNWCPGAIIPIRKIAISKLIKGNHQLRISVPDAKFENKEGSIPFSAYFIGR